MAANWLLNAGMPTWAFWLTALAVCVLPSCCAVYLWRKDDRTLFAVCILLACGVCMNVLVALANGGCMPVDTLGYSDGIHCPMTDATVLPYLGDWIMFV